MEKTLTTYQLNFLRLLCSGVHSGFTAQAVTVSGLSKYAYH